MRVPLDPSYLAKSAWTWSCIYLQKQRCHTQVYKANHGPSFPAARTHLTNVHRAQRFGNISTSTEFNGVCQGNLVRFYHLVSWQVECLPSQRPHKQWCWRLESMLESPCWTFKAPNILTYKPLTPRNHHCVPPSVSLVGQETEATAMP